MKIGRRPRIKIVNHLEKDVEVQGSCILEDDGSWEVTITVRAVEKAPQLVASYRPKFVQCDGCLQAATTIDTEGRPVCWDCSLARQPKR